MLSNRIPQENITLQSLKPGDIVSWVILGTRHLAIYSPVEGQQADLIHMFFNARNEARIFKSTISQPLSTLAADQEMTVIRSRIKDEGLAIAAQAECWLRQGVNYSFNRLARVIYDHNHDVEAPTFAETLSQHLKYAARRATMPVKAPSFPVTQMNWMTKAGLYMVGTGTACGPVSRWGLHLVDYSIATRDQAKGLTCIGFIVAVIAAVKLKHEIGTVTKDTGWVSLKNKSRHERASADFQALLSDASYAGPALDELMTDEQIRNFSFDRLASILTPAIAKTHPHLTHSEDFFTNLLNDQDNWRCMGHLDKKSELKPFNKQAYEAEMKSMRDQMSEGHANFVAGFGVGIFARKAAQQAPIADEARELKSAISYKA